MQPRSHLVAAVMLKLLIRLGPRRDQKPESNDDLATGTQPGAEGMCGVRPMMESGCHIGGRPAVGDPPVGEVFG